MHNYNPLYRGLYADQFERWFRVFDRSQVRRVLSRGDENFRARDTNSAVVDTKPLSASPHMIRVHKIAGIVSNISNHNGRNRQLKRGVMAHFFFFFSHTSPFGLLDKPWSQMSFLPPPGSCLHYFFVHRVQRFHYSTILHRVLLTHALAFSPSEFVRKKKPLRIETSMHSGGFDLTKLAYARLEDDLIRHRGNRLTVYIADQ